MTAMMKKKVFGQALIERAMKNIYKISQAILIVCVIFTSISAAERFSKEKNSDLPIEITAEKMTSDQKSMRIVFVGNVVAKQGNLTIFSDKMTVYNNKKNNKKKGKKIEKIVAQGNVRIEKEERFASGDHAVYIEKEDKIVLTGNPRAWEENNEIVATEMVFLINKDKFIVKGDKEKKIKLTFYPDQKKNKNE